MPTAPLSSTHTGKIGRLPALLRHQLNLRLADGEPGPTLLRWLNDRPETRRVLQTHFAGHPITAQNLSQWRRGGFATWQGRQEIDAWLAHQIEPRVEPGAHLRAVDPTAGLGRTAQLQVWHYLTTLDSTQTPEKRAKLLFQATAQAARLIHTEAQLERARFPRHRWETERADAEKAKVKAKVSAEEKERRIREIFGIGEHWCEKQQPDGTWVSTFPKPDDPVWDAHPDEEGTYRYPDGSRVDYRYTETDRAALKRAAEETAARASQAPAGDDDDATSPPQPTAESTPAPAESNPKSSLSTPAPASGNPSKSNQIQPAPSTPIQPTPSTPPEPPAEIPWENLSPYEKQRRTALFASEICDLNRRRGPSFRPRPFISPLKHKR